MQIVTEILSIYICSVCAEEVKKSFLFRNQVKNNTHIVEKFITQINEQIDDVSGLIDGPSSLDITNAIISIQGFVRPGLEETKVTVDTKPFICDYCKTCFKSKTGLRRHVVQRHLRKRAYYLDPFSCFECPQVTNCVHEKYVDFFKEQKMNGLKLGKCLDCDHECGSILKLIAHVNRDHLRIYPYLCESCGRGFPCMTSQVAHVNKFHATVKPSCQYCCEEFNSTEDLTQHTDRCKDIKRKFACSSCPASFRTEEMLNLHQKKHETVHQCPMCCKAFRTEMILLRHRRAVHEGAFNPLKKKRSPNNRECSICHSEFRDTHELKLHMGEHGPDEKHHCKECHKYFDKRTTYLQHKLSSTHLRRINPKENFTFSCDQCDESYQSSHKLENHKNLVHLKMRPYGCDKCGKQFTTPIHLKHHKQVHETAKKYQCSLCSTMFTSLSGLKKHMLRYHSEQRPHACESCGKSFVCNSELVMHTLKAHSTIKISCPICQAKFSHRRLLKNHFKKVHLREVSVDELLETYKNNKAVMDLLHDKRKPFIEY